MLRLKGAMGTQEFLQVVGERLRSSLAIKDFIILSDLYADVAGIKKKKKEQKKPKDRKPRQAKAAPPTMDEYILELEKESKRGQLNSVGQGQHGQENESGASHPEIQRS